MVNVSTPGALQLSELPLLISEAFTVTEPGLVALNVLVIFCALQIGFTSSVTSITEVQVAVFPSKSVTVSVTFKSLQVLDVIPGTAPPAVSAMLRLAGVIRVQLSVLPLSTWAAETVNGVADKLTGTVVLHNAVGFIPSFTVIVKEQVPTFPVASVWVSVMVFGPRL